MDIDYERIAHIREQLAIIRTYQEPHIAERAIMFTEYWNAGYSVDELAEAFEWQAKSVKSYLTKLGIDWRAREAELILNTPIELEPAPFVWWV